jgi:DNA-binding transcriptional regulator GbsR (MarR family)
MSGRKINGIPAELFLKMQGKIQVPEQVPEPINNVVTNFSTKIVEKEKDVFNTSLIMPRMQQEEINESDDDDEPEETIKEMIKELYEIKQYAYLKYKYGDADIPKLLELLKVKTNDYIEIFFQILKN